MVHRADKPTTQKNAQSASTRNRKYFPLKQETKKLDAEPEKKYFPLPGTKQSETNKSLENKYLPLDNSDQGSAARVAAGRDNQSSVVGKKGQAAFKSHSDSVFNKLVELLKHDKTGTEQGAGASDPQSAAGTPAEDELKKKKEKLKDLCDDFESMFTSSVLNNALENGAIKGYINVGTGEQIFREMLNEKIIQATTKSGSYGISKLLYNQLIKRLEPGASDSSGATDSTGTAGSTEAK
jgi:hypothetical protein